MIPSQSSFMQNMSLLRWMLHLAPTRPFFKLWVLVQPFRDCQKVVPTGLKHQECECKCKCRRGGEKAPIRYVPERDPVQEVLELKPKSLKCTLTNGSKTWVTVWSKHGTNKQFLLLVNKAASVAKNMGLISAFDNAKKAHDSKNVLIRLFYMNSPKLPSMTPWIKLKQRKFC